MVIKEAEFIKVVEKMAEHFKSNIVNRFVKKTLIVHIHDSQIWGQIERMTEIPAYKKVDGWDVEELYDQLLAMAKFIQQVRREILPNIRSMVNSSTDSAHTPVGADKVLKDMAVNNFGANLNVLSDMINELYLLVANYDKAHSGKTGPLFAKNPELKELGQMLVG